VSVLHGDAFDVIPGLLDVSVDLVITSPPYWGHRSYGLEHNWDIWQTWKASRHGKDEVPDYKWYRSHGGVLGLEPIPEWYISHLTEIFDLIRPKLKPRASLWINIGDTYFARWSSIRNNGRQGLSDGARERRRTPMGSYRQEKQLLLIPARFAIAMQARHWILRNDLIWFKPNVPPRPERDRLRLSHEHFFHFVLKPKYGRANYYYDHPSTEPGGYDVVAYPVRAGQNGHTATFPEDVIRPRIISSSPPGGLVLDPFCGTGRAVAVAAQSGRRAIGIDVSTDYVQVALESVRQIALDETSSA
jgi:site-specific DNA-methyltransferase (adenine-specific)